MSNRPPYNQDDEWAGWSSEGTYAVAWYYGQEENFPFALAEADRHLAMHRDEADPAAFGQALVVAAEFARLVDCDRTQGAYMQFTGWDGRNLLNEVNYEELGLGFLVHFMKETE